MNARRALTAAHCYDNDIPIEEYTVTAGSSMKYQSMNNNIRLIKFIPHPYYDDDTSSADIAVLWLERDLVFNPSVQPIRLPNQNEIIAHGATAYVAGWGRTSNRTNSESSRKLKWITLKVVSNRRCNVMYKGDVLNDMLCAGWENCERDSMIGDSGGGLVIGDIQPKIFGVVAWGLDCDEENKYPGVYTRVTSYINWIKSVL